MIQRSNTHILKYLILPLLLLPILSAYCEERVNKTQNIVVQIETNYTISFAELQKYVFDYHYNLMYRSNKAEAYYRGMDDMVLNRLKILDFFNRGLNNNKELLKSIRRTINEELVIQYFRTQFYGKYVNDESIQEAYKEMGKEVVYQQIVLVKPTNASSKVVDSLKTVANDIKIKLDSGVDFAELVKKYSQDVASSRLSGFMPAINWKMSLSNTFNYIIFHLSAGKERILENDQSIYIVKVAKINKIEVQPFEDVKNDILKTLDERYMDFSLKEFDSTKKNLIDENKSKWNKKALKQLVKWSNIPNFYINKYTDTLRHAITDGRNFLILEHPKGNVDLKEYLRLLDDVLTWGRVPSHKEDDIKKFILEAVRTNIIVNKATELNLEKDIVNPRTTNPVIRNGLIRLYNNQIIEGQIPEPTDEALKDFYQANKDSLFYQLAKVNIYAVIDSNKNTINELKRKLDQNIPFEKLAPEILVKTFIRGRDGTINSYLDEEKPFLGEAAFKLKLFETAGPIEYTDPAKGNQYALIKCMAKQEEKQLLYQDVEKTIVDDFKEYHRNKISHAVREQLRNKYPVTIYKDVLKKNLSLIGINE